MRQENVITDSSSSQSNHIESRSGSRGENYRHIMAHSEKQFTAERSDQTIYPDTPTDDATQSGVIPLPTIVVREPVTHDSWEHGKYTTFQICIRTEHPAFHLHVSTVRRRFSELIWLDNFLKAKNQGAALLPSPPPKRIFADRFSESFLKQRVKEMQKYLNKLLEVDQILSDNAFHLFIQTDLTTAELNDYFDGKLPDSMIADAWANMGHIHSNSLLSKPLPAEPQEIVMNEEDSDDSGSRFTTPRHSPVTASDGDVTTTTAATSAASGNNDNDSEQGSDTISINNSICDEAMINNMERLGLPAKAVVELSPTTSVRA